VLDLSKRGFDVFLNLCDGAWGLRTGRVLEVVQVLERLQVPVLTGASSPFYEPSRLNHEAEFAIIADIHSPGLLPFCVGSRAELKRPPLRCAFPMIVKHPCGLCEYRDYQANRGWRLPKALRFAKPSQTVGCFWRRVD